MTPTANRSKADAHREAMLEREQIANRKKHWVRAVTACNSRCLFCLDADTPRNVYLPETEVKAELRRGITELGADKVIISGGEASLHPLFPEFIRFAREVGYERVQTVTNGTRFADPSFYRTCRDAGLGEITFSLHGHTAELHDHLTQTPGAFHKLMKSMIRAIRDPRGPIVNVDICINKQNVGVLDKIVELAIQAGCTEFDLLHVIPQANAFDNRDLMFYDVADHLETLQRVFRLNRHPRFVVWTNRFPVEFLEGMEDLIQDPHKILDEVNGRRFMVRSYLDTGKPLDCRDVERCVHCFIEPFCTSMDRTIAAHRDSRVDVWQLDSVSEAEELPMDEQSGGLPYGIRTVGLKVTSTAELAALKLPPGVGLEVEVSDAAPLPPMHRVARVIASTSAQLDVWFADPSEPPVLVRLNRHTAKWMLEHREQVAGSLHRVWIEQPTWERMQDAVENDVRDPASFFTQLSLPVRVIGLAACQAPHGIPTAGFQRVSASLYDWDTGRIAIRPLARRHVTETYRAKSVRCRSCVLNDSCEGVHINMVRDQGLAQCRPLGTEPWVERAGESLRQQRGALGARVASGRQPELPAGSLPGHAMPSGPATDPLAEVALRLRERRAERARARARGQTPPAANPFGPGVVRSEPTAPHTDD